MITNNPTVNFSSGELAPPVWARVDRPFYTTGVEIMRNFIPFLTGPAKFRPGFQYVNHTRQNKKACLFPFQFNDEQAYILEFTDLKMRVFKDGGAVTETAVNISGISKAAQGVVTANSHGYSDGDEVYLSGIAGMTELNSRFLIVSDKDTNTFKLKDEDGNYIDTSGYTTYTSGGTSARVYEITTLYPESVLWQLKFAQTADIMYFAHPFYAPMKLTRSGHASWTLATYTRTSDPFVLAAKNITGITQASPGVITSTSHGYVTGDRVLIESVGGMTQLNGNSYYAQRIDANTYSLKTIAGVVVDTTGYGAYTSGGTAKRENYPGAVWFFGGRLWFGGSNDDPDMMWSSKAPNATTGATQYDDFTVGTAATDAVVFAISSQNGTAEKIRWGSGTPKFMLIGSFGGTYKANGGSDGATITPTAISVSPVEAYGCEDINPVYAGGHTVYIEKGARTLRSFEFDFLTDGYSAFDKNLLAEDATQGGITQVAFVQGRPDVIWLTRTDGRLLSCTFLSREEVAGWSQHPVGGSAKVWSVATEFQENNFDRPWIVTERTVDGKTRRSIEWMSEDPYIPDLVEYYTGDETSDNLKYRNLTFEKQKEFVRLDGALTLDTTQTTTLTLSAKTGTGVTATAGASVFKAADVGRYIFIKYITGLETGAAIITGYTSATEVTVDTLQDFDSTSVATSGWYLLASQVTNLHHWEGAELGVLVDGGIHEVKTVTDGVITLNYPSRYTIVGFPYKGTIRTLDLEFGASNGVAQGKPRNIHKIVMKFLNTMGGKYGSSTRNLYAVQAAAYRRASWDYTDRPPLLFNGVKELANFDDWSVSKRIHILQEDPLPMTVLALIPFMDVTTE